MAARGDTEPPRWKGGRSQEGRAGREQGDAVAAGEVAEGTYGVLIWGCYLWVPSAVSSVATVALRNPSPGNSLAYVCSTTNRRGTPGPK